ncbi:MAG: LCP family protein [Chloroflexi bacterium]|nr:LCP family protein [Chloroflexota bacterium]
MAQPPPSLPEQDGTPPPPALEAAPPRRRRRLLAIPIAAFVYFALAIITIAQPVSVFGLSLTVPIPGLPPSRIFDLPDRPFTVLIVGLDVRPSQVGGPSRTDSILLLRVDPDRNRAGLLSIPRDTLMQVAQDGGWFEGRINTAYFFNADADDPSAGPAALAATIERNLGLTVDYYITFDQRGAADIIDSAGGVTVNVRRAFGQDNYSDDDVNVVPQFFEEGTQHLNGYEAVAYGRIREGSSDFDRIIRQQQVAEGLVSELSSPLHIGRLPGVWNAYRGAVETSMSTRQSAGLFVFLKRIGTGRIVTRSLGDAAVSCSRCVASLVQLVPGETARIIEEAFGDAEAGETAAQRIVAAGVAP